MKLRFIVILRVEHLGCQPGAQQKFSHGARCKMLHTRNRMRFWRVADGSSGDGGIDGIISLHKLGLEKVYVQAKRWQQKVGRSEVRAFYGTLARQRATKGVFITNFAFTAHAMEFARSAEK